MSCTDHYRRFCLAKHTNSISKDQHARCMTPTVSQITHAIKNLLEDEFFSVRVEGEVSQPKVSRNGHMYFTLKDDNAQLSCVMWRSTRERKNIELEHGQQLICGGDIQVYPPHGRYQLMVKSVEQAGMGALQQKFEQMKQRLEDEGLFDRIHKQPLPAFPKRIGVITSETSAAWEDIRMNIEQRYPLAVIELYHAATQGVQSAPQLVKGLNFFARTDRVDVIIMGRGGGSLEDLWPFNEESVARAVFNSQIPVISAVGHETDFSITDFVADVRANTPTQAAILATPDINELRLDVEQLAMTLEQRIGYRFERLENTVRQLSEAYVLGRIRDQLSVQEGLVQAAEQHLKSQIRYKIQQQEVIDSARQSLKNQLRHRLQEQGHKVDKLSHRLEINDPNQALKQGYSRIWQHETWIKKKEAFDTQQPFEVEWQDGRQQHD